MRRIIAIGGGEIKDGETRAIDKYILDVTGKSKPRLLFLPTASSDDQGYWKTIDRVFGKELGALTSVLMLTQNPLDSEIKEKIAQADVIYVGGGNTKMMLELWEKRGVDVLLRNAYENGVVLSGLSAGAICWFEYGSTDSPRFNNPRDTKFILIRGLGLMNGIASPHHIREPNRINALKGFVKKKGMTGFGIDDNAALEIVDNKFRVLTSKPDVGVVMVSLDSDGKLQANSLSPGDNYLPFGLNL